MGDLREQIANDKLYPMLKELGVVVDCKLSGPRMQAILLKTAKRILALPGIAELTEDQTIPTHLNPYPEGGAYHNIWNHAMETMYCQDFRKVKPKSYTCPERGEPVDFGLDCRCDRMQGATPLFTGCTKGLPSNWRDRMMKGTILPREEVRE